MVQGQESITKVEENGDVVMVMEKRILSDGKEGQFVLRVRNFSFSCLVVKGQKNVRSDRTVVNWNEMNETKLQNVAFIF